ncbi:MAG: magnesium/cobalt transporter CorA [Pseudomonadota bacterium]
MAYPMKNRAARAGLPPGTLRRAAEQPATPAVIRLLRYTADGVEERAVERLADCFADDSAAVTWIDVQGVDDTATLEAIGTLCGLHPLVLEDIQNTVQRPKVEDYDNYLFLVLRALDYHDDKERLASAQISLVLGRHFVITFQEHECAVLEPVRTRLLNSKGRFRSLGADYLAYALIDVVVDHYFVVLERFGNRIEEVESRLVLHGHPQSVPAIQRLKRDAILLRKTAWPLRELLNELRRGDNLFFQKATQVYLRDVYDHVIEIIDTVETFRDMLSGMLDIYLSSINNRTNEVMKILTVIATIFIPLTFITGVFGMNFKDMPILDYPWAFPATLLVMAGIAGGMLLFFRRKRWLGGFGRR